MAPPYGLWNPKGAEQIFWLEGQGAWIPYKSACPKRIFLCKVGPEPIVINGVMGPREVAENEWVIGVITTIFVES